MAALHLQRPTRHTAALLLPRTRPWPGITTIAALALAAAFVIGGIGPWTEVVRDFFGKSDPFWAREDFTAFYAAGSLVRQGAGPHIYDPGWIAFAEHVAAGRDVGGSGVLYFFNPSFFAGLMSPLSFLSLQQAYQLWTIGSLALLVFNCWLIVRLAGDLSTVAKTLIILGYLTLYPLTFGLRLGQFSLILQASWAGGALLLNAGRDRLAGLSLAALLIKPELALPVLLFLAMKRAWGAIATVGAAALAAVGASIALIGVPAALGYPRFVLGSTTAAGNGVAPPLMINWSGLIAATDGSGPSLARPLAAAMLSLATIGAVVVVLRLPSQRRSLPYALQWFAMTMAALLCDPHLYLQDTVIAVPAAVGVLALAPEPRRVAVGAVLVAGWGVERLALHPNQVWHVNLFAVYVVAAFSAGVIAAAATGAEPRAAGASIEASVVPRPATRAVAPADAGGG